VEVTAATENGRFDILVDGQIFGPYYKIRITPHSTWPARPTLCLFAPFPPGRSVPHLLTGSVLRCAVDEKTKKQVVFPIQTFFPISI
jgi:hypothetical protein